MSWRPGKHGTEDTHYLTKKCCPALKTKESNVLIASQLTAEGSRWVDQM